MSEDESMKMNDDGRIEDEDDESETQTFKMKMNDDGGRMNESETQIFLGFRGEYEDE